MRIIIIIITFIINLQPLTKADDIRDFEIEGMSLGDSALNFFPKNEIDSRKKIGFVYEKKDFYSATFYEKDFF